MKAIRVETVVDEAAARAIPALRPLLGERVELIALHEGREKSAPERKLTLDEVLAARLTPPPGARPVTLEDMELAIAKGASGAGD